MEELMRVMAAKKREAALLQAQKKDKYLRRAEVETILLETTATRESSSNTPGIDAPQTDDTTALQQASKKRKLDSETQQQQQQQHQSNSSSTALEESATFTLPWAEMKKRLRELGEPIRLFGETEQARIDRLRKAEHTVAVRQEDALGEGHRTRNRFVGHDDDQEQQDAAEHADDAADDAEGFDDSSRRAGDRGGASSSSAKRSSHGTSRHGDASAGSRANKNGDNTNNIGGDNDDDDESDLDKLVYRFFKGMLQSWERDLANRPDHIKRTAQGKIATKTMKQCKDYIRPLFKLCKQRDVPPDILPNLVEIVKFCRQGEFVMANDAYIKLAIGNAAWPIGVTMVGIHERTGREKINSNKQAHVMNNESQRKYLTSVKRLISYAQSISSVLPSKKVMS